MNIVIRLKIIGLFLLLAVTGCASAPPRAPIAIDLGADKTFTFKSVNAEGEKITSSDIASAIGSAITKASGFKPVRDVGSEYMPHLDGSKVAVTYFEGIGLTPVPNAFKVAYIKGIRAERGYGRAPVPTGATFGFSIEEGEKILTVKVTPPKQIEVAPLEARQLASDDVIAADVKRIFNNLNPEVTILKKKSFKGVIDVKYSVDAVKANFKRAACGTSRVASMTTCNLEGVNVNYDVVPYKEGSKTTYQFDIRYSLNGQGETTYSPALEKKIISSLENIVKN